MSRLNSSLHVNLTDSVISELFSKGIYTGFDFINKPTDALIKITGLTFKKIIEVKNDFSKLHGGCDVTNASEFYKKELIISTEICSLNELLEGGFRSKQIYEICGASSSGKTQLCLTITAFIPLETNKIVHYIDTKGDFSILRIQQILDAQKCNEEEIGRVMKNIKVTRVKSVNELIAILYNLTKSLKQETETTLLVIDSLSALFLVSKDNPETTYSLNHLRNLLRFITSECNVPIITTNLITQWIEDSMIFIKDSGNSSVLKPTLGKFWFHIPNTRLLMEYIKNEERKISIWKSSDLKIGTNCNVNITSAGVS